MTELKFKQTGLAWLWLALLVLVLDQLSKQLALALLDYAQPIALLPVFDLTLLYNKGAAFSFLAGQDGWQRWFFTALALGVSAATGIISGFMPAWRAARMNPVDALRAE